MIHVIKHDMDPNMDLNYSRKIGPVGPKKQDFWPEFNLL